MKLNSILIIFSMALSLALADEGCGSCGGSRNPFKIIFAAFRNLNFGGLGDCGYDEPEEPTPRCPPCNPKARCRIWRCPCTHDGFIMYPGNEPLNAPRPDDCPKCVSECDNLAIRCLYPYLACDAEQVATFKCIEPIPEDYYNQAVFPDEA